MRRRVGAGRMALILAVFVAALVAIGCGAPPPPPSASGASPSASSASSSPKGKRFRVALILDTGGVDDKSFNAQAYVGFLRAEKELGVEGKWVESKTAADYRTNLTQFAVQGYDLLFAVGYKMEDPLKEVAPQFPAVKFAIVDGNAPSAPNCAALQFREEQGTFLAGFLAASMSKTGTIGFVGGEEIPLIKKFEAGYRAGAKTADANVKVFSAYTGDWNDISKGKSQAQQEFASGADIIFHAAGNAGRGVLDAANGKGPGYYAIGCDMDQDGIYPGRVLASELKRLDNAVFDTVKGAQAGRFSSGPQLFDLKDNGVGLSEMRYTRAQIPAAVLAKLDKIKRAIVAGKIVPPATMEALNSFQAPRL